MTTQPNNPARKEELRCLRISLFVIILLMLWGLLFTELANSDIVELDAGAYIISGLVGLITIYVSKLQDRPGDKSHPLGYIGFVPLLNLIRSFMIILICLKAIGSSIGALVSGPVDTEHGIVFLYLGVTLLANLIAWMYIKRGQKKTGSPILKVEAAEWKIDIYFNLCVILAFLLSYGLDSAGYTTLANHVDPISCIILSVMLAIGPIKLFTENIRKLSIQSVDGATREKIAESFYSQIPHFRSFAPNFTAIDMSGVLWVEIHVNLVKNSGISRETIMEWESQARLILKEINPNHHLTFRLD